VRVIAFGPGRLTYVLYQATYSPELNIIEMIWRKIKYDWLPFEAYNITPFLILKEHYLMCLLILEYPTK
jgi:transposase